MSIRISLLRFFVLCCIMFSCSENPNAGNITGTWVATEWLVDGKPSGREYSEAIFSFDEKGGYTYSYAGSIETGTYKVENDMLFTTPKNEGEIMVKIEKLTTDSLVFGMNRGGTTETILLLRKRD